MLNINRNKYFIIISFLILFLIQSCSDKGVEVQQPNNPRNYIWTLDTLKLSKGESSSLGDVWGINPKDVYALGAGGPNASKFWHYNGESWNDITSSLPLQNLKNPLLSKILGSSKNDIWITGNSSSPNNVAQSLVLHYNGVSWNADNSIQGLGIYNISKLGNSIWVSDHDNIYQYNGTNFVKRQLFPDLLILIKNKYQSLHNISLAVTDTSTYATMWLDNHNGSSETDKYYFVSYKNDTWTVIDSLIDNNMDKWGFYLWYSPAGNLYSFYKNIYKWDGNNWDKILQTNSRIIKMFGTSDNNIFAVGSGASVYHFNGIDWKKINELFLPSVGYSGVWTDGIETFIVGTTIISPIKSVIWHGK